MKKTSEINVQEWTKKASDVVGTVRNLDFQTSTKFGEIAGQYEILSFTPCENQKFTFSHWTQEKNDTPSGLELGFYKIKFHNTKKYNGKEFTFMVKAFFSEKMGDSLYISTKKEEDEKGLLSYKFGFIEI